MGTEEREREREQREREGEEEREREEESGGERASERASDPGTKASAKEQDKCARRVHETSARARFARAQMSENASAQKCCENESEVSQNREREVKKRAGTREIIREGRAASLR
eukprot:4197615-Pleurochrysis_carterae.AAC.1